MNCDYCGDPLGGAFSTVTHVVRHQPQWVMLVHNGDCEELTVTHMLTAHGIPYRHLRVSRSTS